MSMDISKTSEIAGFIGSCLVDSDTGLMLTSYGGGKLDLETAASANTAILKAQKSAAENLRLNDKVEDILITMGKQIHLMRPLSGNPSIFIYVALDRNQTNLGMARLQLKTIEAEFAL